MGPASESILNQLVEEVKTWDRDGQAMLNQKWRERYGFQTAMASIEEMARELAELRGIKL